MQNSKQYSIPASSPKHIDSAAPIMLADQVFEALQDSIVKGELRPNQRVVEIEIARKMGTSRTPVHEALKRLELIGYLTANKSRGLIVADHDMIQIKSLFEIRQALECMALELSCPLVTEEQMRKAEDYITLMGKAIRDHDIERYVDLHGKFHMELYSSCENNRLKSLISIFRYQYFDKMLSRAQTQRELYTILKYHTDILEAVRKRMTLRATKLLTRHIKYSLKIALRRL